MNLDIIDKEIRPEYPRGVGSRPEDEELENPVIPGSRSDSKPPEICIRKAADSDSFPSASANSCSSVPSQVDTASLVSDRTRHGRATRCPVRYQDWKMD